MDVLRRWSSDLQGGEVVCDFGTISTDCPTGGTEYEARATLRRNPHTFCLDLRLRKRGRVIALPLHFRSVDELLAPFQDARARAQRQEGPSGEPSSEGFLSRTLMRLAGQRTVHSYGAVNLYSGVPPQARVDLEILTGPQGYWLNISLRGARVSIMWPLTLVEQLEALAPELRIQPARG
jgi:hypothetical protein